ASHCKQPVEKIAKDTDRDFYMDANAAKAYGIVDEILNKPPSEEGDDEDEK
ncbi:MAG: ATP-dependent Clp protease proteolytic subunit, partial [Blastopirellula sp. JB062]